MGAEGTSPKRPRWLHSVIVLAIGLAYLAAVYLLVPETRRLRLGREPRREPGLEDFEERVCKAAEKVKRLRMTVVSKGSRPGRRVVGTLLLDGDARMRLELRCGDEWHVAWIHDGEEGWLISQASSHIELSRLDDIGDVRREITERGALGLTWADEMALLYPYVDPRELRSLTRGADRIRVLREDVFRGERCRVIRLESRERRLRRQTDLWVVRDGQRLVKLEHTFSYRFGLLGRGRKWRLGWRILSVVSEFDENPTFRDADFDPLPLVREFAESVRSSTAEFIEAEEMFHGTPLRALDSSVNADENEEGESRQEVPE